MQLLATALNVISPISKCCVDMLPLPPAPAAKKYGKYRNKGLELDIIEGAEWILNKKSKPSIRYAPRAV